MPDLRYMKQQTMKALGNPQQVETPDSIHAEKISWGVLEFAISQNRSDEKY